MALKMDVFCQMQRQLSSIWFWRQQHSIEKITQGRFGMGKGQMCKRGKHLAGLLWKASNAQQQWLVLRSCREQAGQRTWTTSISIRSSTIGASTIFAWIFPNQPSLVYIRHYLPNDCCPWTPSEEILPIIRGQFWPNRGRMPSARFLECVYSRQISKCDSWTAKNLS